MQRFRFFAVVTVLLISLPAWSLPGLEKSGGQYVFQTKEGERVPVVFGRAFSDASRVMQSGAAAGMYGPLVVSSEGGIEGVTPIYGAIRLSEKILFQWDGEAVQGVQPALMVFESGSLNHIPFNIKTTDKAVFIPAKRMGLKAGHEYHWYLGSLQGSELVGQSRFFSFRVLSEREEQDLQRDLKHLRQLKLVSKDGEDLLKAQIFYKYDLYHDMVATLQPLYVTYPQEESITRLLFLGYVKIGKRQEAKELQQKWTQMNQEFNSDQQALTE